MGEAHDLGPEQVVYACDLAALTPAERTIHQARLAELFGSHLVERRELPNGYAYRFDGEQLVTLALFIADERRCCPFLRFQLEVAPARGSLWLAMTAPGEVKPFLTAGFGHEGRAPTAPPAQARAQGLRE